MTLSASDKACILTLKSTFGNRYFDWQLDEVAEVRISQTMRDLYLVDFPLAWENPDDRKRLVVIGPNDYFYKWGDNKFSYFVDTPLSYLLEKVEDRHAAGCIMEGKIAGLPLSGGNHQLLFINRRYTDVVPASFTDLFAETWRLRNDHTVLWPFVYPTNACYFVLPLLYGYGAPLWTDTTHPEIGITFDALYKVLELHKQLLYDEILLPVKWEEYHSVYEFQTLRAAFCIGGEWDIKSHYEAIGQDLVVAPIPALDRECRSTASCNYLFISNELEFKFFESVARAADCILSDKVQSDLVYSLNRFSTRKGLSIDFSKLDHLFRCSYQVYSSAVFLTPHKILSHIYHALADVFEPGVLVKYPLDQLVNRVYEKMMDINSTLSIRDF